MPRGGKREGAGRPPGRANKATADLKAYAQQFNAEAIDVAVEIMRDADAPQASRIAAASMVLDRGHGKPESKADVTIGRRTAREMTRDELYAIAAGSGEGASEEAGLGREPDRVH